MIGGWEVGQLAEIEWKVRSATGTTRCWWDSGAEWWRPVSGRSFSPCGSEGCDPKYVTAVRPQKLVPQDAIVLPKLDPDGESWLDSDDIRIIATSINVAGWPWASRVLSMLAEAVDVAAPVEVPSTPEPVEQPERVSDAQLAEWDRRLHDPGSVLPLSRFAAAQLIAEVQAWRGAESDSPASDRRAWPTVPVNDPKSRDGQITGQDNTTPVTTPDEAARKLLRSAIRTGNFDLRPAFGGCAGGPGPEDHVIEQLWPVIEAAVRARVAGEERQRVQRILDEADLFAADAPFVEAAWALRADLLAAGPVVPAEPVAHEAVHAGVVDYVDLPAETTEPNGETVSVKPVEVASVQIASLPLDELGGWEELAEALGARIETAAAGQSGEYYSTLVWPDGRTAGERDRLAIISADSELPPVEFQTAQYEHDEELHRLAAEVARYRAAIEVALVELRPAEAASGSTARQLRLNTAVSVLAAVLGDGG